jgi:hypothetical protein
VSFCTSFNQNLNLLSYHHAKTITIIQLISKSALHNLIAHDQSLKIEVELAKLEIHAAMMESAREREMSKEKNCMPIIKISVE